jgi:glycosyltransferase involved in cell wall biosynthesis
LRRKRDDTALLLVGRGSLQDVERFGSLKDVIVLRNVPYETLMVCFASCDIYCTASRWEGFDLPLVAAQANRKPVVAYDVGAHPEVMLNGETGFLVDTSGELQHCLEMLLEDDELRTKMGEKGARYTKKFSWRASMEKLEKVVDLLTKKRGVRSR